jgi:hypothetical protein
MNAQVRGVKACGPKVNYLAESAPELGCIAHKKMAGDDGGGGLHNARLFVAAVRLGCGR